MLSGGYCWLVFDPSSESQKMVQCGDTSVQPLTPTVQPLTPTPKKPQEIEPPQTGRSSI